MMRLARWRQRRAEARRAENDWTRLRLIMCAVEGKPGAEAVLAAFDRDHPRTALALAVTPTEKEK